MSCTTFGNRRTNALNDETDEQKHRRISKFSMEHRCQYPRRKNTKNNRRRSSLVAPPSKIFFFLLLIVSHLVATATLVVSATSVVGEQNGDATIKEDEENGDLNGEQERKVLFSSHDLNEEEEEEIVVDSIINDMKEDISSDEQTTDDSEITEETDGDASNNKSDPSSNDNEASEETTIAQKNDALEMEDDIDTLAREDVTEETTGSSPPSLSEETTTSKAAEVEEENDKKESIDKPLHESIIEETENTILSSSENETKDEEVQKDTAMGDETTTTTTTTTTTQEVKEEEKEKNIPSVTSSSSSENSELLESENVEIKKDLGDGVQTHEPNLETEEKPYATSSSSSEKTTKARPQVIEKKKDIDGGASEPLAKTDNQNSQNSNEPSDVPTTNAKDQKIQKKTTIENAEKDDGTEEVEEQEETSNENTETDTQDEDTSSIPEKTQTAPVHDNGNANDDSYIDLDADSEGSERKAVKEKKAEEKVEDDESDLQSVTIKDENTEDVISGVNDKARARARARADRDRRSTEPAKTVLSEDPVAATTDGYRGEPWGQYRSTRRLPDLELLQLVFENTNKTRGNRATGDIKSQKVVNDWKKDPLYDENIAMDAGSQKPLLVDEEDQQFLNYRSQLLGENGDGAASVNPNYESKTGNDKSNEDTDDNADDNSESVEGLDFFEGVDPPDELDVGHGSSIQDVLMDKGKHILLKKVRGVARWIRARWQTMRRKLEERISEFQSPFHKIEGATNTAPDFDAEALDSSESNVSNAQRDRIVAGMRESLISVWKAGKQTVEVVSDLVDGLLDRFDGRSEDDSTNFEDFDGFDLDDLSTFPPPQ